MNCRLDLNDNLLWYRNAFEEILDQERRRIRLETKALHERMRALQTSESTILDQNDALVICPLVTTTDC